MSIIRMTEEEYQRRQLRKKAIAGRECPEPPKRNKYGNVPQVANGQKYRSKREMKRHEELLTLERIGTLRNLCREIPYVLAPSVVIQGRKRPPLRYIADYVYDRQTLTGWGTIVEDAKGFRNSVYIIKRHLMMAVHGIEILET